MRHMTWMAAAALVALAACGGPTSPYGGGGVTGGGGGGGGPVGHVTVGNIFFRSAHNGTQNPAVDTVAAGSTVTWSWNAAGSHSIQSTGTPAIFRNSVVMSGASDSYSVTLNNPGTYTYQCGVHGASMTGRIVVQ
jgi:plastocyanin